MKRRSQMVGIRVGVFEETHDHEDLRCFLLRVNETLLKLAGDPNDPIHMKPFDKAGTYGHRVVESVEDVERISDDEFPALLERHLSGQEFACEVFTHNRKICFLNISEYVHLGYSVFIAASPELEAFFPNEVDDTEGNPRVFSRLSSKAGDLGAAAPAGGRGEPVLRVP